MADAQRVTEIRPRWVEQEVDSYILTLTQDEANTLASILSRIGGNSELSPRKHADSISRALRSVGVNYRRTPEDALHSDGHPNVAYRSAIRFDNYETGE